MSFNLHERIYRGEDALRKLASARIVLCGAGAIGSQLADNLVRHGARDLLVVDRDRVEEHNLGTQTFDRSEIGAWKAEAVQARCFRAVGVEVEALAKPLDERNIAKALRRADVVVDAFDNSASRGLVTEFCRVQNLACLHMGVNEDFAQVQWSEGYRVPQDVGALGACDYPLARNLLLFTVALGCESLLRFLWHGQKENLSFTLSDFSVNSENEFQNFCSTS